MASKAAKTLRKRAAIARLEALAATARERFGIESPAPLHPAVRRDADLEEITTLEQTADLLAAVLAQPEPTPIRRQSKPKAA